MLFAVTGGYVCLVFVVLVSCVLRLVMGVLWFWVKLIVLVL